MRGGGEIVPLALSVLLWKYSLVRLGLSLKKKNRTNFTVALTGCVNPTQFTQPFMYETVPSVPTSALWAESAC